MGLGWPELGSYRRSISWSQRAHMWAAGSWYPLTLPMSSVCSSPPIHMKVQPLNQTALQVSWSQPETIYHPPIMNYMISYSWTKNEDEKEKTFTKDSDKDLVRPLGLKLVHIPCTVPREYISSYREVGVVRKRSMEAGRPASQDKIVSQARWKQRPHLIWSSYFHAGDVAYGCSCSHTLTHSYTLIPPPPHARIHTDFSLSIHCKQAPFFWWGCYSTICYVRSNVMEGHTAREHCVSVISYTYPTSAATSSYFLPQLCLLLSTVPTTPCLTWQ